MLDMIHLAYDQLSNVSRLKRLPGVKASYGVRDKNFEKCFVFRGERDTPLFTLKSNPVLSNLKRSKLIVNPSRLGSIHELDKIVYTATGGEDSSITRIDFASDMDIPIEEVASSVYAKGKQVRIDYVTGTGLSGLEFGSKQSPELILIYDKALEVLSRSRYKRVKGALLGACTRFEVRNKKNKIAHSKYSNLGQYLNHNPFKGIQSFTLGGEDYTCKRFQKKLEAFQMLAEAEGFHNARRALNKRNNFKRDFSNALTPSTLQDELLTKHQKDLKRFFGKERHEQ